MRVEVIQVARCGGGLLKVGVGFLPLLGKSEREESELEEACAGERVSRVP